MENKVNFEETLQQLSVQLNDAEDPMSSPNEEPNAFTDTLFDDSVLPKCQESLNAKKYSIDQAQALYEALESIKTLYFGIKDSTFNKYQIIFDDQKYDIQSLVDSNEFKNTFLAILETKFLEKVALFKQFVNSLQG